MSLLDDLRAAAPSDRSDRPEWWLTERALLLLLRDATGVKVSVNRGAVEVEGRVPGRWFAGRLRSVEDSERLRVEGEDSIEARARRTAGTWAPIGPPGTRLAHVGLGSSRDDVHENHLAAPFSAWLPPEPGALGAWIAGIVLSAERDWPEPTRRLGRPRTP